MVTYYATNRPKELKKLKPTYVEAPPLDQVHPLLRPTTRQSG